MCTSTQIKRLRCALVVDNEPSVLNLVQTILESSGFFVLVARTGGHALKLLDRYRVDVLVTDIALLGITASELVVSARQKYPGLPVCCMAADLVQAVQLPEQVSLLAKPFRIRDFLQCVQTAIDSRAGQIHLRGDAASAD